MSILFPIDLKFLGITALRYLSKRDPQFSPSSAKHMKTVLYSVPFMSMIELTASSPLELFSLVDFLPVHFAK